MSLYETLNINKSATKQEIKSAYRKLSKKHHPDIKGGDHDKFSAISYAYNILIDDNKRNHYDSTGQTDIPDIYKAAKLNLTALFNNILETKNDDWINNTNIIYYMEKTIKDNMRKLKNDIKDICKKRRKLNKLLNRIECDKNEINIFNSLINQKISDMKRTGLKTYQEIKLGRAGLKILNEYKDTIKNPYGLGDLSNFATLSGKLHYRSNTFFGFNL